jgi:hypothetical protein
MKNPAAAIPIIIDTIKMANKQEYGKVIIGYNTRVTSHLHLLNFDFLESIYLRDRMTRSKDNDRKK